MDQIEDRIDLYLKIVDRLDDDQFAKRSQVQRNSPTVWNECDWHYRKFLADQPVEAGLFDMYRFDRIAEKSDTRFTW